MSASKGNNKGGVFARKQGVCNGGEWRCSYKSLNFIGSAVKKLLEVPELRGHELQAVFNEDSSGRTD